MGSFILALQFLTIIPVGTKMAADKKKLSSCTLYFPIIGLVLGLILAGLNRLLLLMQVDIFLTNVILIVSLIILTGGLHMDGLADTADAFLSRKNKPEMLKIMRDSHIGTMGVLSLISVILVKLGLLSSLSLNIKGLSLILMCLLSRYSLVFSIFLFPYAREDGKAKLFIEGMNFKIFSFATVITMACAFFLSGLKGLILFAAAISAAFLIGKYITKRIGGITGDTLGTVDELTEVIILLTVLILTRNCVWIMP